MQRKYKYDYLLLYFFRFFSDLPDIKFSLSTNRIFYDYNKNKLFVEDPLEKDKNICRCDDLHKNIFYKEIEYSIKWINNSNV